MEYLLTERDRDRLIGLLDTIEASVALDDDESGMPPRAATRLARALVERTRPLGGTAPAGAWVVTVDGEAGALVEPALDGEGVAAGALRTLERHGRRPRRVGVGVVIGLRGYHLAAQVDDKPTVVDCEARWYSREQLRRYTFLGGTGDELAVLAAPPEQTPDILVALVHEIVGFVPVGDPVRVDDRVLLVAQQHATPPLAVFALRDEGPA